MPSGSTATLEGVQSATPYLTVRDAARAIEFYKKAFGATELMRLSEPGGRIGHAEIRIGDALIMLADEYPEYGIRGPEALGGSPVTIHLYVEDVDSFAGRAVAAGAKLVRPVKDEFYGDRSGRLADPFGHGWIVSTRKEVVSSEEMQRRFDAILKQESDTKAARSVSPIPEGFHTVTPYLQVERAAELLEFVKRAFGATETFRTSEPSGELTHAEVRIGDSMVMMGGSPGMQYDMLPGTIHLYVEDADALYWRALAAGASSLQEPVDQDYGDREAGVKDPFGNTWYLATHKARPGHYVPEGLRSVTPYLHPRGAARMIDFLKAAFGAGEDERAQLPDGTIVHAKVRIGDSVVEMGEARSDYQPVPCAILLYVEDVDALYQRAVLAGAISKEEPEDKPYGDRNAAVKDPFGNTWYLSTHIKDVAM